MNGQLIPAASLIAAPWRNGRGISRDIVRHPAWTVSIADLEADGPFSDYPNIDRIFTPIAGDPPPELAFNGGPFEPCPLLIPKPFGGDIPTLSRIPAPGRAFNVLVERGVMRADVTVTPLPDGAVLNAPDAPHVVVHCLTGQLDAAGTTLGPGDSMVGHGTMRMTATQTGIAIVVAIRSAA